MLKALARFCADQKDRCLRVVDSCVDEHARDSVRCLTTQKEAQLGYFITQAPGALAMFDRNMRYLAASRRWQSVFRLEGDLVGRSNDDAFPETPEQWKDLTLQAQAGEVVSEDRVAFVSSDGGVQWLRCGLQPWRRAEGSIGGIVVYVEDITDNVIDQERVRQSEATLRAIGDNLPDSVVYQYTRDRAGNARFLYISAGVEKLTGVTVEEALADANALYAQVLPEYLPKFIEAERAAKRAMSDFAVEAPIRRKDGEVRWMRLRSRPERRPNGAILWNGVWTDITESVADQEKLRQSEAMLRAMGDNLPDSFVYRYRRDAAGNPQYLYVSAGVERLTGVTAEEILTDAGALYAQVLPEYLPRLLAAEQAVKRDLADFAVDAPIRRKDGEVRWMRLRSRPERQPNGETVWNGVQTDITESVADQEKLRQSEAMLRAIGDSLPDSAIYQWTRDQKGVAKYLYVSAGIEKLTGLSVERFLVDTGVVLSLVLPEYRQALVAADQKCQREVSDFDVKTPIRRMDGEVRWVRMHSRPEPQPDGQIIWNGVWTDITEAVTDQERLRQSEAMLRAISDNLPDSAVFRWTRDRNGVARYLYVSAGIEKLTGLTVEQVLANDDAMRSQVLPEYLPTLVEAEQNSQRSVSDVAVEIPIRRADGEVRWMRLRSRPERQPGGQIIRNGVWTDITESVADQERLRQKRSEPTCDRRQPARQRCVSVYARFGRQVWISVYQRGRPKAYWRYRPGGSGRRQSVVRESPARIFAQAV